MVVALYRSSPRKSSIKMLLLKISQYLQETPLVESSLTFIGVFFIDLSACNFIKKRFQHTCFPVNIARFLRRPTLKNICERLPLTLKYQYKRLVVVNTKLIFTEMIRITEEYSVPCQTSWWKKNFFQKQLTTFSR